MKKTFTLLAATCFSVILFAQSKLSITTTGNADIRVMVDGQKYKAANDGIMINNLKPGSHVVKIFKATNDRYRSQGNNRNNANGYQLVYGSTLLLKPQYHVDITINRFGKAFVDEQMISGGYNDNDDDDWGVDNNDQYYDRYSRRAMDKNAFQQLKQSISNESFDNTKLKIAKQYIAANYFNAAQVKELVLLFNFENSRLDIAKYAYDYTVDKGNYFMVNEAFSFSNSKDELMNYIQARK